jgi:hypothetical protein
VQAQGPQNNSGNSGSKIGVLHRGVLHRKAEILCSGSMEYARKFGPRKPSRGEESAGMEEIRAEKGPAWSATPCEP